MFQPVLGLPVIGVFPVLHTQGSTKFCLDVIGLLHKKGAEVSYHDPYIPSLSEDSIQLDSVADLSEALKTSDCVVIITNHSQYDYDEILDFASCIVDTRNALGEAGRNNPKVVRL